MEEGRGNKAGVGWGEKQRVLKEEEGGTKQGRTERGGKHLFSDLQCPLAQRLRLLVFASFAIENSQIVECSSHLGK